MTRLEYLAHIARIEISPKEVKQYSSYLDKSICFVDKIKQAQVDDVEVEIIPYAGELRQDVALYSTWYSDLTDLAETSDSGHYITPKAID